MSYTVITFEDPSTGNGAIYFEDQPLVGFNYEYGIPMPGISSSASEWNQCKELGGKRAVHFAGTLEIYHRSTMFYVVRFIND